MTLKEFRQQIKLRYTANVYENVSDRDRKFYRLGFKSGYKLAKEFFKTNIRHKQTVIKEVVKYVTSLVSCSVKDAVPDASTK